MKKTLIFIGSVIILVLAAITFIFIPAMAGNAQPDTLVFGKYGNKKIEYKQGTEFANAVANYTEMYRRQGAELKDSDMYYIYNYAFTSAVQAAAYSEGMKKAGWAPSSQSVARQMYPYFADENGNYSSAIFNSYSEDDKSRLKADITRGLVWSRYSEDLLGSQSKYAGHTLYGLKSSDAEIAFIENMAAEKRSFEMAVYEKSDYPDSAVKAWGEANKDKFVKYNLSVITVKDQSKAKSILNQIKKDEITFEDAVSEYSDKAYSGSNGKLSSNFGYQIKEILKKESDSEVLFNMELNGLSDVIDTNAGWSIFHNDLAKKEPDFSDASLLSAVRSYINDKEAGLIEDYYIGEAKKVIEDASVKGFAAAAKAGKAKFVKVPAFALNYDGVSLLGELPEEITSVSGASSNENFLQTAFSLKEGAYSEPVVAGNSIIVLKAAGIKKDTLKTEEKDALVKGIADYDSSTSQSTLLSSKKVENKVAEVFFNKIMSNK
jgi:hypothetical protein